MGMTQNRVSEGPSWPTLICWGDSAGKNFHKPTAAFSFVSQGASCFWPHMGYVCEQWVISQRQKEQTKLFQPITQSIVVQTAPPIYCFFWLLLTSHFGWLLSFHLSLFSFCGWSVSQFLPLTAILADSKSFHVPHWSQIHRYICYMVSNASKLLSCSSPQCLRTDSNNVATSGSDTVADTHRVLYPR